MSIYRDREAGCWVFDFDRRVAGQRVRLRKRLPKTWDRAKADAYDRQETARLYAVATGVEKPAVGIERAVTLYLQERAPALKHGHRVSQELMLIAWAYRGRNLSDLPAVAAKIREEWTGKLAPATIRNRIRYLTSACRWGWKHHHLCEHDPAARVTVPEVRNERTNYTDREGMLRICLATQCRQTRRLVRIAFYTGMRIGEIFAAEVGDGLLMLADTKNGTVRHIPVDPRIRAAVATLPFTWSRSTLEKRYSAAREAIGMEDLRLHDLRHSTATEMVNAGVDLFTVGAVLGHKSPQSTKRYAHHKTDTLGAALGKVGRKVPQRGGPKAA